MTRTWERILLRAMIVVGAMGSAGCATLVTVEPDEDRTGGAPGAGGESVEAPDALASGGGSGGAVEAPPEGWREAGAISCVDHDAALAGDGRVLAVGVCVLDGMDIGAAAFDPQTERWTAVSGLPPLLGATATRIADGRVVVLGGGTVDGRESSAVSVLEPGATALAWRATLSEPRRDHAAVALPDGSVLVIGGWSTPATTAVVDVVNVHAHTLAEGPMLLSARDAPSGVWWEGAVLTFGGSGDDGGMLTSVERSQNLEPWSPFPELPSLPGAPTPIAAGAELLLFDDFGGHRRSAEGWVALADRGTTLVSRSAVRLDDGRVLVAGIQLWSGQLATSLYDERTDAWQVGPLPNNPHNGTHVTLSKLLDGRVLLVGNGAEIWSP